MAHRTRSPNSRQFCPMTPLIALRALGDPLRLQIALVLARGELCVCDLGEHLGVAQSRLSFHLRVLREANLIHSRPDGRWIYYSLNTTAFAELQSFLQPLANSLPPSRERCL
ncbi:MAG: winged helix-turn-helix transcriptional regulator [Oscillatoriales cyanobacterium SM2_1_8]|nr:winged helix-turn-helix transcriptional regulator [Oscillatoriales cyanobacterium SM2_1_8]